MNNIIHFINGIFILCKNLIADLIEESIYRRNYYRSTIICMAIIIIIEQVQTCDINIHM